MKGLGALLSSNYVPRCFGRLLWILRLVWCFSPWMRLLAKVLCIRARPTFLRRSFDWFLLTCKQMQMHAPWSCQSILKERINFRQRQVPTLVAYAVVSAAIYQPLYWNAQSLRWFGRVNNSRRKVWFNRYLNICIVIIIVLFSKIVFWTCRDCL